MNGSSTQTAIRKNEPLWKRAFGRVRRRRKLRPTRVGIGAIILVLLIAFAAFNTGTNLLYVMLSTLLAFWAVSGIFARTNLARLTPEWQIPPEIYADRLCRIGLKLSNSRRFVSSYAVMAMDRIQKKSPPFTGRMAFFYLNVAPKKDATQWAEIRFHNRGWVNLQRLTLRSMFPFGFLDCRSDHTLVEKVLVYPRLIPVGPILRRLASDPGQRESPARGQGSSLYAIREYLPGDAARNIHWKLSSKGTGIKLREFEREESQRIRLVVAPPMPPEPGTEDLERFEKYLSIAASLARHFVDGGFEVSMWTPAGAIPAGRDAAHLRRIMRTLAQAEPADYAAGKTTRPTSEMDVNEIWIAQEMALDSADEKSKASRNKIQLLNPDDLTEAEYPTE